MIPALFFVPVEDTIHACEALANQVGNEEQTVLDYFESNYVGELRRLQPIFPHTLGNMNIRIQEQLPCSINGLEGWHTGFVGGFCHYHAHTWKFIKELSENSSINHLQMEQIITGAANPLQRVAYQEFIG